MIKKEILQDLDRDDLTPPPYWIMTHLPPSAPPGLEATLLLNPGPGEVPAAATGLPPALLEFVELLFRQVPIPAMDASGQCSQNSTSAGPPRLYPPLPMSTDRKGDENTVISQRLRSAKKQGEEPDYKCPSESYNSLQFRMHGALPSAPVAYYYQPFSSTDILNWQKHAPPYSGEPQAMIRQLETIF